MARRVSVRVESWPIDGGFRISRGVKHEAVVVVVEIVDGAHRGWGEGVPYGRFGESAESVVAAVEQISSALADGLGREALRTMLPAGAARNAIDCALWDLACQQRREPVYRCAGLAEPEQLLTAYTLSIDTPARMQAAAERHAARPLLKIKLGSDGDLGRLRAVRAGAPDAQLVVDANEGWSPQRYRALAPQLQQLGVVMVEQPLAADADQFLQDEPRPVPICADESFVVGAPLEQLARRYDAVNLKLDKMGGLTEALDMARRVQQAGMTFMVGCHVCTSLSLAPAMLLCGGARIVDLDAGLLLSRDRDDGVRYRGSLMQPLPALWGVPRESAH